MKPKAAIIFLLITFALSTTCEKPERTNPWDEKANLDPSAWAPQYLQIEDVTITEKKLTWRYTGKNIEGFKLDRKKGDEAWQVAYQTFPKETRSWNDAEIVPDPPITYAYRVYAYAGNHNSAEQNISASSAIATPTNLKITNNSIHSIVLTWQFNSAGEDGFKIERKYEGGNWAQLATVTSNNYADNNFDLNTHVYYRVCTFAGNYISSWTETSFDAAIPPPENLQITINSTTSVTLNWDYNPTGHEGFKIELKIDNGNWEILEAGLNPNQNSITYDGLDLPKHDYRYRVYAFYGAFQSDYAEGLAHYVLTIGDIYKGGIVFYLDGNGGGLVCAQSDQSTGAKWGCRGTTIGGTGTGIGTGAANTTAIVAGCSETGIAARICDQLVLNGYNDWFLPSKDELNLMYKNLKLNGFGGFAAAYYWSSSEYSSTNAWSQYFSNGYQYTNIKNYTVYVRAVRAF